MGRFPWLTTIIRDMRAIKRTTPNERLLTPPAGAGEVGGNEQQEEHANESSSAGAGEEEQQEQNVEDTTSTQGMEEDDERVNISYIDTLFKMMPAIVGKRKWAQLGRETEGAFGEMVNVTDEVMMLWVLDCYWNEWMPIENWKMDQNRSEELVMSTEEYEEFHVGRPLAEPFFIRNPKQQGRAVSAAPIGSKKKFGGITMLGKKRWNIYCKRVVESRNSPCNNKFEEEFTKRWKEINGRNNKKRKVEKCEDDDIEVVAMDDL